MYRDWKWFLEMALLSARRSKPVVNERLEPCKGGLACVHRREAHCWLHGQSYSPCVFELRLSVGVRQVQAQWHDGHMPFPMEGGLESWSLSRRATVGRCRHDVKEGDGLCHVDTAAVLVCFSGFVLCPNPARQHLGSRAICHFLFVHTSHSDQGPWYCPWLMSHQQISTPRGVPREAGGEGMSSGARDPGASRRKRRELTPGVPSMQASVCTVMHLPCALPCMSVERAHCTLCKASTICIVVHIHVHSLAE